MLRSETSFEKLRGISRIEVRSGFTLVHVRGLSSPVHRARLELLSAIADENLSLDFVKLAAQGLSFVVKDKDAERLSKVLQTQKAAFDWHEGCAIVAVHAVNMRDEEGMIARIVQNAIKSGIEINQMGDMHDRLLMVLDGESAQMLASTFEKELVGAGDAS